MEPTNLVEPGDERLQRAALGDGFGEVPRPQLVLLGVEILLASRPGRSALEKFVTGVHPPRGSQRGGQHGSDGKHSRTAVLQALVQDVRGVDEEVGPGVVGVLGDLATELLEF